MSYDLHTSDDVLPALGTGPVMGQGGPDWELFERVLSRVSTGETKFEASMAEDVTLAVFMRWIMAQPDAMALYAALLTAEADHLSAKAQELQKRLSERIDWGLVRTKEIAAVETSQINRLFNEAENLRFLAMQKFL